ncbi:flagellar hook-associated protein FlgK [Mangrovicella endophytica]|uniref:flagellar hook-associated protein FlgK n=1 Tax=Mangrovicella endophytica TaxID=2066697 RepID=UPI000C9E7362|nr:flagellar hook-associated protein FlgK [Mangrovicella endophytica]
MSLSSALESAKSAVSTASTQTSIVSRNVANVNSTTATRKIVNVTTAANGGSQIVTVTRATNSTLFRNMLDANASVGASGALLDGLDRLQGTIGDTDDENSPAALIGVLGDALTAYSVDPSNSQLARNAVQSAQDIVSRLNEASGVVASIRQDADNDIAGAANDMNKLLAQFQQLNEKIIRGTRSNTDVTDMADQRDQIVVQLSNYIGVTARTRGDNDMVLYTDSGVTLFENVPRKVEYTKTVPLTPGVPGNVFRIDGVAVTGDNSTMPLKSGKIAGLMALRDNVANTYQAQLDQIAGALVRAFAETDQTASGLPTKAGLFTSASAMYLPDLSTASSAVPAGLAGTLKVADGAYATPSLIRDGGFNGVSYVQNGGASAPTGFAGRINGFIANLSSTRSFDTAATELDATTTLANFATASVGWLSAMRSNATSEAEYKSTLLDRTQETLSNATGINLDDEMTHLLDLEHSYQASAKLIAAINQMLDTLLETNF